MLAVIRVEKQGGIVWMALAMMVATRLGLGGISEQRDLPLIRRLIERVRRCAHRPLLVSTMARCPTSGLFGKPFAIPYIRVKGDSHSSVHGAMSASPKSSSATSGGVWSTRTPVASGWQRRHAWNAPTPLARGRGDQHRVHRTAERDIPRYLAPLARRLSGAGSPHPDAARGHVLGRHGL